MKSTLLLALLAVCNIGFAQVIINEIQSSNLSTLADNYGEYEDWIEIYNPTDAQIDIGGLVLKDNVDVWQIPTGDASTILQPNTYFLLWADDEESQGKFHTNFKLSASNGEFLGLYQSDSITEIETLNIPPLPRDQSYIKCDGTWLVSNNPSPLKANACPGLAIMEPSRDDVKVFPTITTGEIQVELANVSSGQVGIQLYTLDGKLVLYKTSFQNAFSIDLHGLKNNIYALKIICQKKIYTKKIVLQKL